MNKLLILTGLLGILVVGLAIFAVQFSVAKSSSSASERQVSCMIPDGEGGYIPGSGTQCNQACGSTPSVTGTGCTVAKCIQAGGVACLYQCDTVASPSVYVIPGATCTSGLCSASGTSCEP